jgi:hypothetical protein
MDIIFIFCNCSSDAVILVKTYEMELYIDNEKIEIEDRIPEIGQYALFNNKIWKVCELWGGEIIHLQRPHKNESVSLYGKQIHDVKTVYM